MKAEQYLQYIYIYYYIYTHGELDTKNYQRVLNFLGRKVMELVNSSAELADSVMTKFWTAWWTYGWGETDRE